MGTIVRRNERSWAIEMISQMNFMLARRNLRIKRAGGECTLSVQKQSMFPDVLLYGDEGQTKILQGWELKMPDVPITDEAFRRDAERKAVALGLSSFVIWNFTYAKLYVREDDIFYEARVFDRTDYISTREEVALYRREWMAVLEEVLLTVNDYLAEGRIRGASIAESLSDSLVAEIIQRNKETVARSLEGEAARSMKMESRLKVWWQAFHEEYERDETNLYSAYAKSVLLNWVNRILFANLIKKYHDCARRIDGLNRDSSPADGNRMMEEIVAEGDFFNVFQPLEFNEGIPEDTWMDLVDYNEFLCRNRIENVEQSVLKDIMEKTVHTAKREIRGQFATPDALADILCQVTIEDWSRHCGDFCAGTGTIAKAVLKNKGKRLPGPGEVFETTWIGDKYAYPLQIANIALTSIEVLNLPLHLFQADVFSLKPGQEVLLRNPSDGSKIRKELPYFHGIVSNLPFVKYNNIAADEAAYLEAVRQSVSEHTGILFPAGKADLYHFIPFWLHGLLEPGGKLGVILSNSWLGTQVGLKFYQALLYYYELQTVVLSNEGRWFENADVVGTLAVLQKKEEISPPKGNESIQFGLTNFDIKEKDENKIERLVHSIVLKKELDSTVFRRKEYRVSEISGILKHGVTLNALFHNLDWMEEMQEHLIPIGEILTVKRGERRGWNDLFYPKGPHGIEAEYMKPVLKKPARLKSFTARADMQAFCCSRSKEELAAAGHLGALSWIERFESVRNQTGKLLPAALKRSGHYWYEMDDGAKADFVTILNPDRRLFVAKFEETTFVDQRFTRMLKKDETVSMNLVHALLNSIYGMFAMEAIGFGRGLGVLDATSTKLKKLYLINPYEIREGDRKEIERLFDKIQARDVKEVTAELQDPVRRQFEEAVLRAIGCEHLYEGIKASLLSMQHTRHTAEKGSRK